MDGMKGALEAPALAQKLVKALEGSTRQAGGFAGSTKLCQVADFCLTAKDVKYCSTRLCMCKRREVPFRTFPTCLWLHKPESAEPDVAMTTCVPYSFHSFPCLSLNNAIGLKEQEPPPE